LQCICMGGLRKICVPTTQWARLTVCFRSGSAIIWPHTFPRLPEDAAHTALQSILTSSKVPNAVTRRLTMLLIAAVVSSGDSADSVPSRAILSTIQQRYPSILQKVADETIAEKEDVTEAVEQLIISLSMVTVSQHVYIRTIIDHCVDIFN
jgi:hypothetical protein